MNTVQLAFALVLLACLAFAQEKAATNEKTLTCWKCSSNTTDAPCIDGKKLNDSADTETCSGEEPACVKIFSHVYGLTSGDMDWSVHPPVVSRFCAKNHPLHDIGCSASEGIKGMQVYCLCDDENKCNSAARPTYVIATVITLIAAYLFH